MNKINLPNKQDLLRHLRFSPLEWGALAATVIFASVVAFYYLNSTQPLRSRLNELRLKEKTLQGSIKDKTAQQSELASQLKNRDQILESLESFEARLHSRKTGITAIIDEVNQIAKAHRVKAGDISFRTDPPQPLPGEAVPGASPGTTPTPAPITRRDKLPIVYEGLGIDTTVEGDYADLRRFISALEHSRNFVIISTITLQSIDEKQRSKFKTTPGLGAPVNPVGGPAQLAQPGGAPGLEVGPPGAMHVVVALKIEMETHFSRANEPKLLPVNAPAQR